LIPARPQGRDGVEAGLIRLKLRFHVRVELRDNDSRARNNTARSVRNPTGNRSGIDLAEKQRGAAEGEKLALEGIRPDVVGDERNRD
jgi:hypothetical protein